MGSSDRRMTSRLCYNYFRIGGATFQEDPLQRLILAEFLCESVSDLVDVHRSQWSTHQQAPLPDKIGFLAGQGISFEDDIFPFHRHLSQAIDKKAFCRSHLVQPDLFIRVQKHAVAEVEAELAKNAIPFDKVRPYSYRLPNGAQLQQIKKIEGLFEVQDLSSQESLDVAEIEKGQSWWDACAASGGKSLLLLHKEPNLQLMVSDIRLSVLRNLDERFLQANVKTHYRKKVLDLTEDVDHIMQNERFDGIILDAPCSGSGTWGRTPEMIKQFSEDKIRDFSSLQRNITKRAADYLKKNGQLVYITCSVFREENEEVIDYLEKECGLKLEELKLIAGYNRKSDSMFAARLRKI
ncbi:Fmu (Sun) domain protein [Sphingobacterium deserti]|uniref:Fmu (Sun) domain protein n=2 Tax=Sphingobacterium deserti TaxID=1229276 RepID=A0A0B8T5C8_9SPHI|nr:Fmu (Sun) domain protein [Sphingobacterium deserti]